MPDVLDNEQSAIKGFIQAGGRSSRMGVDKAWAEIDGTPMIERVISATIPLITNLSVIINAANPNIGHYERLVERYAARLITDLHDHRGPLGGIHTALSNCREDESALILACDLPFMTTEFLELLICIHRQQPADLMLPLDRKGRLQPLAGLYSAFCMTAVEQMLAENILRVDQLCSRVRTRKVLFEEYAQLPNAERILENVNTMDAVKRLCVS